MAFLRNAWYMAGWAYDLNPGGILARTICNDPIVIFRDAEGRLGALEDRCCHRHYPLSASGGCVIGSHIQCGYHGLQYDASGKCVKIPSQSHIPESARVGSYAIVERQSCLWVWLGDAAHADMSKLPDLPFLDSPDWGWKGTYFPVKGNYRFIIENLLDLTHLTFVHTTTIGNAALIDRADVKTIRGDAEVQVNRWMIDSDPPPSYAKATKFTTKVDRWQLIKYVMPSIVYLWTGAAPHGMNARDKVAKHGAPEGSKLGGIGLINFNLITPETEKTTHYFWGQGQDKKPQDQATTDMVFEQIEMAFKQDWALFEQQQMRTDQRPDAPRVNMQGDAGGVHAMLILDKAIEAEQQQKLRVAA